MSKNLLFITSRLLWPVDGGRKMSLNYYCKGLHENFGYNVYLYCFLESGQKYEGEHPDYIKNVYIAENIGSREKIVNFITKTCTYTHWPAQCSLYFSKKNFSRIQEIYNQIRPEVVFTEMIRTAAYFQAFNRPGVKTIANLDDLLSKRYRRQSLHLKSNTNIAGVYSGRLPVFINRIMSNPTIKNMLLRYEANHCEKWEQLYYEMYDFCMFTSPIETGEMNELMQGKKAITLSVGIDYEYFARPIDNLFKEPNSLSYVGNFKVAANCDTLKMICDEILPLIKHKYKFYVIGSCPDDIRKRYESEYVIFVGRVDDLAASIRKTEIFFSPISYGTGIKTKIVEAMAMRMPVITNNIGVEGIAGSSGTHFIVANDYAELAAQVDYLLNHHDLMNKIGHMAQEFAYQHYRWEVVYQSFYEAGL